MNKWTLLSDSPLSYSHLQDLPISVFKIYKAFPKGAQWDLPSLFREGILFIYKEVNSVYLN